MIDNICNAITNAIKDNVEDINNDKVEVIHYGLYVFIADILKILVMLSLAYFLGIFKFSLVAFICIAALRSFAGGVHAKTQLGCLFASLLINYGVVYVSLTLSISNTVLFYLVIYFICFSILYFFAPSDHENKPVVSKKQRRFLKLASLTVLTLMFITAAVLLKQPYSNLIMISAFSEVLTILPLTYKLTNNRYGFVK